MLVIAFTVAIALLGTTLAAMNTGVRISFAMAQDSEMPGVLGLLHDRFATPYVAVWIMIGVSALIGTIGVTGGVVALTGITLASNLGTFVLYALICVITFIAFAGSHEFHAVRHSLSPALGVLANLLMVFSIFLIGIMSGGATAESTYLALAISAGWLALSAAYFVINSVRQGKAIIPATGEMESK